MDININFNSGLNQEAKDWIMAALDDALAAQASEIKTHLDAANSRFQADLTALRNQVTDLQAQVIATTGDPAPVVKAAFADVLTTIDNMDAPATLPPNVLPATDPTTAPTGQPAS